jgi:hypothetical protein
MPYSSYNPNYLQKQTPPLTDWQDIGEFQVSIIQPPSPQAGTSFLARATFVHRIDGPLGGQNNPWTSGPTLSILDGNGNTVSSNVTIGTVTKDQGDNGSYFSVVQLGASLPPGNYLVQWTGTYTPVNTQEPQVALPIQARKRFVVLNLKSPSQFYFLDTKMI